MDGAADHAGHAENPAGRGIRRVWLDWNEPCLPAAADWLAEAAGPDLGTWIVVTPGRRAGRRLLEAMLDHGGREAVEPPELLTPAHAIDVLLAIDAPLATPEECLWAWVRTLADAEPDRIEPLLPRRPDADDVTGWLALARACRRRVEDLAAGCLRPADVVTRVADFDRPEEPERWRALARMDEAVRRRLATVGLIDPVEARQSALRERRVRRDRSVVLVGVTELSPLLRAVLSLLDGPSITALVHAPEARAEHFDALGAVDVEAWAEERNILPDDVIEVTSNPNDQAARMLDALARLGAGRPPETVTIGLADEEAVDGLHLAAAAAGISAHVAAGRPLERTAPYRLLAAWCDWIRTGSARALAALVRHPDLERRDAPREALEWLMRERFVDDVADDRELAAIETTGLDVIDTPWAELARDDRDRFLATQHARTVRRTVQRYERMAVGLRGAALPAAKWAATILGILETVYGDVDPSDERQAPTVDACVRLRDALAAFARAAAGLVPDVPPATALDAFLRNLAGETVPDRAEPGQIEMLGWLELHLDPAPALVLTGVREGTVPESIEGDFLLPDALRRRLGLACNRTRLARDAYLLSAIAHAREALVVIAPRQGAEAEPHRPSRLLLAVDDDALVERVRRLCVTAEDAGPAPVILPGGAGPAPGNRSQFEVALARLHTLLPTLEPPAAMSVTEFRSYLNCPFRYALQHRLKLDIRSDTGVELDAMGFGSLTHEVLEAFGDDEELRDSEDAVKIAEALSRLLDRAVNARYRHVLSAAAFIQIERARQRLAAFAVRQAEERRAGWRIVHTEFRCEEEVGVPVPGGAPMPLRGRIDRIDIHPKHGARILDYKTTDSPKKPEDSYRKRSETWTDLQLPLYRLIGDQHPELDLPRPIRLGYVVLPRKPIDTAFMLADKWTDDIINDGIALAGEIAGKVRAGSFEANEEFVDRYDDWERICRTNVLSDEATLLETFP